jgi:hypothetical protein
MFRRQFASGSKSPAWQRKEGKSESGGLNRKGIASYRAANPGSKLSMAVTTKPSKLKAGSKAANRRKSFCARMKGMKKRLTSAKTARDPDSRINKSLKKVELLMIKNYRDIIVLLITAGVLILLAVIIVGDYWVALEENRPVDESVITLMKMSVTGLIGVVGGYIGGSKNDR